MCIFVRHERTNEQSALPSVLTLVVLLGLIDELLPRSTEAAESLRRCLPWATHLTLTSSPAFEPTTNPEAVFAFAVGLCTKLAPDLVGGALEVARPNSALAAVTVASLLRVMSRDAVDALLLGIGCSVASIRTDARAWADVTGRPIDDAAARQLADQE